MTNIVVTETCNLACPYCFASEFVNNKGREISIDDFQKALDFVVSSHSFNGLIGLIGGEPTLHHQFSELLEIVRNNNQVKEVVIFTNGIRIGETAHLTSDDKFSFLINLNSPEIIGSRNYSHIVKNVDDLVSKYDKRHSITLGLNLYELDMDYGFFFDLLRQYRFRNARLSITAPNSRGEKDGLRRLVAFKESAYQLYIELRYRGVNVIFDCNRIPPCLWTDEEIKKIALMQANSSSERMGFNLSSNKCNPVIDILPDLTAIRCFGLSECSKVALANFATFDEIVNHFKSNIDEVFINKPTVEACLDCEMFKNHLCYGGCLANKPFLTTVTPVNTVMKHQLEDEAEGID